MCTLGKLVDTYIVGRKDKSGSYFAFVKFEGVKDIQVMLNSLNKVRCGHCILKVNMAKYEKNPTSKELVKPNCRVLYPRHKKSYDGWNKTSGRRSYADTVRGRSGVPTTSSPPPIPPVNLKSIKAMKNLVSLLGEVTGFQLLSNLPKMINADGEIPCYAYYAGGLKVILKFSSLGAAERYLKNELLWNRWFKWLKPGISDDTQFERIAWVKLIGLPIHLRSDDNAILVASKFGKVIEVVGCQNWHGIDLSFANARILTPCRKLINNKILCSFNGKSFTVGLVECEDSWVPFSKFYESDSESFPQDNENIVDDEDDELERPDSDDKGISETWENNRNVDHDLEEGEFVADFGENNIPRAGVDHTTSPEKSKNFENPINAFNSEGVKSHEEYQAINGVNSNSTISPTDVIISEATQTIPCTVGNLICPNRPILIPSAQFHTNPTDRGDGPPDFMFGGSHSKKRKRDHSDRFCIPCSLTPRRLSLEFSGPPPLNAQPQNLNFDLNESVHISSSSNSSIDSSSEGISNIIKVGDEVGFQINEDSINILEGIESNVVAGDGVPIDHQ